MSDSGASYIETLKIEQWKLSRNSNGHNFSLGCPIQAHHISRRSKLKNGTSREIQIVITFNMEVRFKHITYGGARNLTTDDLEKFK